MTERKKKTSKKARPQKPSGRKESQKSRPGPDAPRLLEQVRRLQEQPDQVKLLGFWGERKFSNKSWAELAATMIMETDLPKYERELLGDLVVDAVTNKDIRKSVLDHYAAARQLKKRGKPPVK